MLVVNLIRNLALVAAYGALGTVLWAAFVDAVNVPPRAGRIPLRSAFKAGSLIFFIGCAWDHLEHAIHWQDITDYQSISHVVPGVLQAVGAWVVVSILYYLLVYVPRSLVR